ncbi:hypothetical protein C1646_756582 [Rhizophagus diaphanus]|nr:hypothetical protein C1646_756582 [Rhizophagus diaphanus] [Rhizophagus sp. MUCL 43196]
MSINPLFLGEIDDERGDINDLEYVDNISGISIYTSMNGYNITNKLIKEYWKKVDSGRSSDENTISNPARNITAEDIYPNKKDQSEQEISTTSKLTARPSSSSVAQSSQIQLYSPPIFLKRIRPSLMKELSDPGIRDPKESLNWDEDSIDIEFLELIEQGRIVGYLNW